MYVVREEGKHCIYIECVHRPTDSTSISVVDGFTRGLKTMYLALSRIGILRC